MRTQNKIGSADSANLATACMDEARRRLGENASLSSVVQLATRIETAVGRVRVTNETVEKRIAEVWERIERAVDAVNKEQNVKH